jgi:hypothetical protein
MKKAKLLMVGHPTSDTGWMAETEHFPLLLCCALCAACCGFCGAALCGCATSAVC